MRTALQRLDLKTVKGKGCWEWTGAMGDYGYGIILYKGKRFAAHRLSWIVRVGEIPEGMCVLHKCDNKQCTKPSHLFLGTQADNMRDCYSKGRHWAQKQTECLRGHPLSGENIRVGKDHRRICRICERLRIRKHRAKLKGKPFPPCGGKAFAGGVTRNGEMDQYARKPEADAAGASLAGVR